MNIYEAHALAIKAIDVLCRLDEAERKPNSAVPRFVTSSGELRLFMGALIELVSAQYPELFNDAEVVADLGRIQYRQMH